MQKDQIYAQKYGDFMRDIITKGYMEPVHHDEPNPQNVWYIPHFGVFHSRKQKFRVVFDCAARVSGICLKDLPGPNLSGPN